MTIRIAGGTAYRLEGAEHAPVVVLAHSLATDHRAWDEIAAGLAGAFRVLRYDLRGHGRSEASDGAYTLEGLADDLALLLDAVGVDRVHLVGLSIGGMIAQAFALRHAARLDRLVLASTLSELPEGGRATWDARIAAARQDGIEPLVAPTLSRWFTPGFLDAHPEVAERVGAMIRGTSLAGYTGCCAAVRELALTEHLGAVRVPALVLVGAEDQGTPPAMAKVIAEALPDARLRVIDGVAHQMQIQAPDVVLAELRAFLSR